MAKPKSVSPKIPTQLAIAKELKLSRTTVAEILGGRVSHRYNAETCRMVLEAARNANYRPNRAAQMVRRGRSNLIGIVHFGGMYEVSRQVRHFLTQGISASGYNYSVNELHPYDGGSRLAMERLLEERVEGVIISGMVEAFGADDISLLTQAGVPAVTLAGSENWGIPAVYEDAHDAMRRMTNHVIGVGHRRILLLTNLYQARPTASRISGFSEAIEANGGVLLPSVSALPKKADSGVIGMVARVEADRGVFDMLACSYRYMHQLIAAKAVPDVILCHNDQWARGVIAAALEAGLRIPEDVAVTGFDNEALSSYAPYYLTSVAQPSAVAAEKTLSLIVGLIQGRTFSQEKYAFPCDLVVRRSCGSGASNLVGRSSSLHA